MRRTIGASLSLVAILASIGAFGAGSCDGSEAARVSVPVVADATHLGPVTTDLGYLVTLTQARLVASRLTFTIEGETHAGNARPSPLRSAARAHPGHYAGGESTGELAGPVVVDWFAADPSLGVASLLAGVYHGADLELALGAAHHALLSGDPLLDHGAYLEGTAERDGRTVRFSARLDLPDPATLVGLPLELVLGPETRVTLGLALSPSDPVEGDTFFDGLDFFSLAGDAEAYDFEGAARNRLGRAFFTHDYHLVSVTPEGAP